jgi:uncharacterized protein
MWIDRPSIMPDETFFKSIDRIKEHCLLSGQKSVEITFHGGEPFLVGPKRMGRWCEHAKRVLGGTVDVHFTVQTNSTLVNDAWIRTLRQYEVTVGVSLDGPEHINDASRVDRHGRGSHARVVEGVTRLSSAGLRLGALAVIQPGVDGLSVHNHLKKLGFQYINYLLPHYTHEEMPDVWKTYGPTPCADYLMPILEAWWETGTTQQEIGLFWQMCRVILGGRSMTDQFGNRLLSFVFVETDGSIEGLDTLKVSTNGASDTGLNVFDNKFIEIRDKSGLHAKAIFDGMPLPKACIGCPEELTCAGGHLGDRYSEANQFDNRSVWCRDLEFLFGQMRKYLDLSPEETRLRRISLSDQIKSPGTGLVMEQVETAQSHVDLLPRTLMWATSGDEIKSAKAIHLSRLKGAFHAFMNKLDTEASADARHLAELVSASSKEEIDCLLLCPNISNPLIWGQRPDGEVLRELMAYLVLQGQAGRHAHLMGPYWCPSGNKYVDRNGAVSQWPVLGDQVGVDLDSPDAVAIGSEMPLAAHNWRPMDEEKREATLRSLDEAYACIRDAQPSLDTFMESCTRAVVLRQSGNGKFASFSSCYFIGRIALVNPQIVEPMLLAEALLHEAIHSYLYMLEPDPYWGLVSASGSANAKVRSPWTGNELPLYAFLHASFVWYGLFFFWARLMQNNRGPNGNVPDYLAYAASGFTRGSLVDVIDKRNRGMVKEAVLAAMGFMQRNVIGVTGAS